MTQMKKILTLCVLLGLLGVTLADAAPEKTRDIAERVFKASSVAEENQFVKDFEELERREQNGDLSAKFYLALHDGQLCRLTENRELRTSSKLCTQAFTRMRSVAENSTIRIIWLGPASMEAFAKMHLDGIGAAPSTLLASHWFAMTAQQFFKNGDSEAALRQVEAALSAVPDNPAALQLRNEIFLLQK